MFNYLIDKQYGGILNPPDIFNVTHSPQRCQELLDRETASGASMFPQASTSKPLLGHVNADGASIIVSTIYYQLFFLSVEWWPLPTGSRVACNVKVTSYGRFQMTAVWMFAGLVWTAHVLMMLNTEFVAGMQPSDFGVVAVQNVALVLLLWGNYVFFRRKLRKDRDKCIQTVRRILGAPA